MIFIKEMRYQWIFFSDDINYLSVIPNILDIMRSGPKLRDVI